MLLKSLDYSGEKVTILARTNKENPEDVDFSGPTNRNVFDLSDGDKIVPGCKYIATLEVVNNTDVAFAYWIEIVPTGDVDIALANQLEITVQLDGKTQTDLVSIRRVPAFPSTV